MATTQAQDTLPIYSKVLKWLRENQGLAILIALAATFMFFILREAFSSPRDMLKFVRLTYAGLTDGALLALIALGLVLVFKSTDVINFAHMEFMLLGGFIGYQFLIWFEPLMQSGFVSTLPTSMQQPIVVFLAISGMIGVSVLIGIILERLILRPLIGEPVISVIMVTIGLSNIFHAIVGSIWGTLPQKLPVEVIPDDMFTEAGRFEIALEGARRPVFLSHENLVLIALVLMITALLLLFFQRSKYGIAMRAAADDQQAAMSMGISIRVVFAFAWSLAAVTAAIAGLMIGETSVGVSAQEIPVVGLRAFPVIILGGLDSISGAILGGLIIGLVEVYTGGYLDPSLKNIAPYVVLLIILMVRPYGLFGQEIIERV